MKKTIVVIVISLIAIKMYPQTFLTDDFSSGTMPPTGWSIENLAAQWDNSMSNKAGCNAPEAKFSYIDLTSFSRFVSPEIAVYSITGKPIYVGDNFKGRSIELSSQPNGVYFIRIIDGGEVVTRRVVLSR